MKTFVICAIIVGCALAEKSGPYPPQGWKPQGQRLELPSRQYGVPQDANKVEITTTINEYVPPAIPRNEDDFLQVQGLPAENSFSQFRNFQQQQQQQAQLAQSQSRSNGQPFLLSPAFAPQFASPNEQLRQQSFQNNNNDQFSRQQNFQNPNNLPFDANNNAQFGGNGKYLI